MIDSSPSSVAEPRQVRVMVYVKQASPLISRILIGVNLVVFLAMIGIGSIPQPKASTFSAITIAGRQ